MMKSPRGVEPNTTTTTNSNNTNNNTNSNSNSTNNTPPKILVSSHSTTLHSSHTINLFHAVAAAVGISSNINPTNTNTSTNNDENFTTHDNNNNTNNTINNTNNTNNNTNNNNTNNTSSNDNNASYNTNGTSGNGTTSTTTNNNNNANTNNAYNNNTSNSGIDFSMSSSSVLGDAVPVDASNGSTTAATEKKGGAELQSVLWKKGMLSSWHKCQFILTTTRTLKYRYFPEDNSRPPDWRTRSLEECVVKNAEGLTNRPYSFVLFFGENKKTIILAAENEVTRDEWMDRIKESSGHDLGKMKMLHLLEGMHGCVVVSDERGVIIGFNKAAKKMFGYSHSEAVGKNVSILMPEPNKTSHPGYISKHLATGVTNIIGTTRRVLGERKDGTVFPLEIGLGKIHTHEGQTRFIATMREITTKTSAETLSMVDHAHSQIQQQLSSLTVSVGTEFEKLRKRILDLEHDNREYEVIIEGLHKKVDYHLCWREAAESVLRDKQREEIKKILAKSNRATAAASEMVPKNDAEEIENEQFQEFQLQTSLLIYPHMLKEMHSWLPGPARIKKPTLMYSTAMHGSSLTAFLARGNVTPNLLLVRAETTNHVFGGYFSQGWIRSTHYYGDGQCFLFTLLPLAKKFSWSPGQPTQFMMVSDHIIIGGGVKGHGLWIDLGDKMAVTEACETFDSDPLVNTNEPFKIDLLELYGFF